jgi:hypothetical protein
VTTPARTFIDCARHVDRPWALAIADAVRRRYQLAPPDLVAAAARNPTAPGHPAPLWAAGLARTEPESPLESLCRAVIVLGGHPEPIAQVWLATHRGPIRADLLDRGGRVMIEADGRLKYETPRTLWDEKLREDAARDLGLEVVRFTMADYRNPRPWLVRFERALRRAEARGGPPPYRP